jgi:hypothetical protein
MDKALETQLANIQKRTGKTLDQLTALVKNSGLEKHGEMVAMLKTTLGMGHGDANTVAHNHECVYRDASACLLTQPAI